MPLFKPSSRKPRVVRKRLADSSLKTYTHARQTARAPRFDPQSIGALTVAYRLSPDWTALAEQTRRTYNVYLKELERLQNQPVEAITRRMILDLRDGIAVSRGRGASAGFVRSASALFGWAVDRDWIAASPVHRVKILPGGHLAAWTLAQADHAMRALPEHYRRVVVLALYTGQRRGDLVRLPWSAYDGHTIRLTQQKTHARLVLPAHPELRAELDAWHLEARSSIILTTARGLPWMPQHLSHTLPMALARVGLPPLGVHGLRKLAATRLATQGAARARSQPSPGTAP